MNPHLCSGRKCALLGIILVFSTVILSACVGTPSPSYSVDYDPKTGVAPLLVSFSVNTSDMGLGVTWDFGDGSSGSGTRVSHVYTDPGEYSAGIRWTLPGGMSGDRSGLQVKVFNPKDLPGNFTIGNLTAADRVYLSTLQKKIELFDQYYIEYTYLNKSQGTAMRYTAREFQFAMSQSLSQLESIGVSPGLDQVRNSARILFTNATDGAHAEFLAGINLEKDSFGKAASFLEQAQPKMEIAKGERDRLVRLLEAFP